MTNSTSSYDSLVAKGSSVASRALADVFNTWRYILGAIGISLIICFVYLGLLRWLAGPIVWTTIIVTNGVFIGLAIWLYYFWTANQTAYNSLASSQQTQTALWEVQGIEAAFILSAITAGVLLLICIFLRKRFNIAIQVIREASRAVITMPLISKQVVRRRMGRIIVGV